MCNTGHKHTKNVVVIALKQIFVKTFSARLSPTERKRFDFTLLN